MHINEIEIKKFGPLKDRQFKLNGGLNIFYGKNESGKTTMVDLIIRELFRYRKRKGLQNLTPFENAERYKKEEFSGHIKITDNGNKYCLPEDSKKFIFEDIFGDILLSRLICVESGDLAIPSESTFFDSIKEKLSGTEGGIAQIKKIIYANAGLPQSGEMSKGSNFFDEYEGLKSKIGTYRELALKLDSIRECEKSLNQIKNDISDLDDNRLLAAKDDFNDYLKIKNEMASFKGLSQENFKKLLKLKAREDELDSLTVEIKNEIESLTEEIESNQKKLSLKTSSINNIKDKTSSRVFLEISEDLENFLVLKNFVKSYGPYEVISQTLFIVLASAGILSALYIHYKELGTYWISLVIILSAGLSFLFWETIRSKKARMEKTSRRIKTQTDELGIDVPKDPDKWDMDLLSGIKASKNSLEGEIGQIKNSIESSGNKLKTKKKKLEGTALEKKLARQELSTLLNNSSIDSVELYESRLKEFQNLSVRFEKKKSSLEKLTGRDEKRWEELLGKISSKKGNAHWDPGLYEKLREKRDNLENEMTRLTNPFIDEGIKKPLDILIRIDEVEIQLDNMQTTLDAVDLCNKILKEMESERDELLLQTLSDPKSIIFNYIEKILGKSRIEKISLDNNDFHIQMNSKQHYPLSHLSRGAQDQLMLAFRLAILENVTDSPHFIILDDALLTSDWTRREALIGIMKDFISKGWQVLYYTFDQHTRDKLQKNIKDSNIFEL